MDEQENSGGEQQAEQQEQQQQHAAQDGSAGATTEYESVEVPLYDVSWRARHRREWKRPCRVCADEARAARRAVPRSSFPSTHATHPPIININVTQTTTALGGPAAARRDREVLHLGQRPAAPLVGGGERQSSRGMEGEPLTEGIESACAAACRARAVMKCARARRRRRRRAQHQNNRNDTTQTQKRNDRRSAPRCAAWSRPTSRARCCRSCSR